MARVGRPGAPLPGRVAEPGSVGSLFGPGVSLFGVFAPEPGALVRLHGPLDPELGSFVPEDDHTAPLLGGHARLLGPVEPQHGFVVPLLGAVVPRLGLVASLLGPVVELLGPVALLCAARGFVTFPFVLVPVAGSPVGAAEQLVERRRAKLRRRELAAIQRWREPSWVGRGLARGRGQPAPLTRPKPQALPGGSRL
jgi:hypothetical protein